MGLLRHARTAFRLQVSPFWPSSAQVFLRRGLRGNGEAPTVCFKPAREALGSARRLLAHLLAFGVLFVEIERETRRETASAPKQRAAEGPNPGLGALGFG